MADSMDVYFMDVAQGDCTYIELGEDGTANKESYLIDFGYKQRPFVGDDPPGQTLTMLVALISAASQARGSAVPYIDHLFVTHADGDHWNMLAKLVAGDDGTGVNAWAAHWPGPPPTLHIGTLTFGGTTGDYITGRVQNRADWASIRAAAANETVLTDQEHAPQDGGGVVAPSWTGLGGDLNIYLISCNVPTKASFGGNPKSLCLIFEFDGFKVMLLGDAEAPVIRANMAAWYPHGGQAFLNCDVLKLSHHGSRKGTPAWWGDIVRPRYVFGSGGYYWAHPYQEAFTHADNAGTVIPNALKHWFASSNGDYVSVSTQTANFSSLWYVVTGAAVLTADDEAGVTRSYGPGMYTGVAWLLEKPRGAAPVMAFSPENVWPGVDQVPV